ncbi:flagellar hook-associated protein FlgK [Roseovarius sp. SCSIO 43702]|uniref:flagellar hook-associated protein FlgK n=1 Tax=Roseovarius sp. SCSIO 43702 TaxID=2823043 RepID=UPI001C733599|nr:flagellar hook-associated protein FlgK [Roseovarius sp. SCSIO 43702]QYX57077.1 flagellar hook-associated protein FlgK [Roseovarius sp. SCSIO 43702]
MSLTSALTNALSGLTANSRAASVVASNLANLHTPGYGRREIVLSADGVARTGGVRVEGISRRMNQSVLADRRVADGAVSGSRTSAAFFRRIEQAVGTPDQPGSLTARLAAFEASLTTAASRPDLPERLDAVGARAGELARTFRAVSTEIQGQRESAEAAIATSVATLNRSLEQVSDLNSEIQAALRGGFDHSALEDQRQVVIDRISSIVPVRETAREDGAVGLVSTGGAILLDRRPARFDFTPANAIVADMTVTGGGLSQVLVNGEPVPTGGKGGPLRGGELAALFEIRDTHAVAVQDALDAVARGLVERFAAPSVDATLTPGDPALFTDGGQPFDSADETGLASRLDLNALVDPDRGGASWRLRDGLGAAAPGQTGDASILAAMRDALAVRSPLGAPGAGGATASLAAHAAAMTSGIAQSRLTHDENSTIAASRQGELEAMLLTDGVDSDAETQRLLLIEQAYAANARMIEAVDQMMQALLRI